MKKFKPNMILSALISSGVALASTPLLAQQNNANTATDDDQTEVIQVSGIRGSLIKAQAIKMDNTSIVEALSAEDIGKLPDTSVAESLSRLPGVTGERRSGRTSGLSVRGFNENYVGTSLNGRELLGMGDNRGVEYDLYPTEIVSNILVYKAPQAGQITQGIGGSIDLQTVSPLNADPTLVLNLDYEKNAEDSPNPDYDNDGNRISLNFVDQFADDKLGIALVVASQETARQEQQFRSWGYPVVDEPGNSRSAERSAADGVNVPPGTVILGGHDSFNRSALLERDSISAIVEYAPDDSLNIKFDALYIDFEENEAKRGLEEGGAVWGTQAYTVTDVQNGLATEAFHDGFLSVIRNDAKQQKAELKTFGLNVEYFLNDEWTVELDLSTGDVDKTITDVESYSGVGRAGEEGRTATARAWRMTSSGAVFSNHPTLNTIDLTDPSLIRLAGPQAWGNPVIGSDAQDGFVNQPIFEESLDSFRLQAEGLVEWSIFTGVEFGVVYSERSKSKLNTGAFLTSPTYPNSDNLPEIIGITNLDFIGINGVLAYDSLGLYNSGYYSETDAATIENGRLGDTYTVDEEITTVYGRLDLESELGDMAVRGNIGLQIVSVDQHSSGFSTVSDLNARTVATPVEGGDSYTDVLPTLNLSFEVAEDQFVKTSLSKVLSRPRIDDMKPNTSSTFAFNDSRITSTDPDNGPWGGTAGNPTLKPLEANQFDLSYENYFSDSGYFAVTFFYKDLKNWHKDDSILTSFEDVYIPEIHQTSGLTDIDGDGIVDAPQAPGTLLGGVASKTDGLTGFARGWELQGSIPFDLIHSSLEGFGIVASATFIDGELDVASPDDDNRIPGLSEESYSLTFFYESEGFEFRISGTKRDDYLTEERGLSLALEDQTDQGGELWDAQIGYDFSSSGIASLHGLRVTLKAQNITDEETVRTDANDPRLINRHQSFGANYLLGLNYTF